MPRQAILFVVDTQGANCVGAFTGNAALQTPNIDRLAAKGVLFQHAYTCAPVCGPARSALFTGLYPHSNGVLANDMAPHSDIPSIGQRLTSAAIPAAYIGKWHLDGTDYFGDGRCPPGWDPAYWFDGRNYLNSLASERERALSRQVMGPAEIAAHGITEDFTHAHRIADRARDYIARHRHEDFFLVVSIDEPHHPCICPEPFVSGFDDFEFPVPNARDSLAGKPRAQHEWAGHSRSAAAGLSGAEGQTVLKSPRYFACNSYSDYEVGRVIESIAAETPDAFVLYTADHGDMLGSHGLFGKGPAMYEEVTRIPLIARWPGRAPAGFKSEAPVSHSDLAATLLDFFGIGIPPILQGVSLLGQIQNPATAAHDAVFIEFNRFEVDHDGFGAFAPIRCVFDGRYKLSINLLDVDELYDLAQDPLELNNCIADPACADVRGHLHRRLLEWMGVTRDPFRGPHWGRRVWAELPGSTWGGPTRPRPFDPAFYPKTLLYDTGREIDRPLYAKD